MQQPVGPTEERKLNFNRDALIEGKRFKEPLMEKMLRRFPRLATALGARNGRSEGEPTIGGLAKMMKASGSIDFIGRDKRSYQFYIRPMI